MAILYPENIEFCKSSAEKKLFNKFKNFSDDFHIIHSFGWLSSIVSKELNRFTPDGEIDFVILHKKFGILCVEIKGGRITYNRMAFFANGSPIRNPFEQVKENTYALRRINDGLKNVKIGYAVGFPDDVVYNFNNEQDNVTFDLVNDNNLEDRIIKIYQYWNDSLNEKSNSEYYDIEKILNSLLPKSMNVLNGKIEYDNRQWLTLSDTQSEIITEALNNKSYFISGRAGTGKTILATILARVLVEKENPKILFLSYNKKITAQIKCDLLYLSDNIDVLTFHHFLKINNVLDEVKFIVKNEKVVLEEIIKIVPNTYDYLIIDEAQSFAQIWLNLLKIYFKEKKIYVFADELQSFGYEGNIQDKTMNKIFKFSGEMVLSKNYRSPYKVYKRLIEMFRPKVEQTTPRNIDELDLVEIICEDYLENEIKNIVDKLLDEQIDKDNIIILVSSIADESLKKFNYKDIEISTVQTYRGMEKPIVIYIVTSADKKDLNELYIAYSRATTQTIVMIPKNALSKGQSYFEKMLLNSEFTNNNLKNNLQEVIDSFNNLLLTNHNCLNLYNISLHYSDTYLLFSNTEYSFINMLLINHFLLDNISSIHINKYDVDTARFYSLKFQNLRNSTLKYEYCENCRTVTYRSLYYEKENFCVNCFRNELKKVNAFDIKHVFNALENSVKYQFSIASFSDSLRTIGRFYYRKFNDKLTEEVFQLLNSQSAVKDISCIIEILIVIEKYDGNTITIDDLRESPKIKKLNVSESDWKSEIGININRFIKLNILEKVSLKEKIKTYKINKNRAFK